jgi:signal transduction histidine kinase
VKHAAVRIGWPVFAAAGLAVTILVLPEYARTVLTPVVRAELPTWHLTAAGYQAWMIAENAGSTLVFLAVTAILYFRAPRDLMAQFCAYALLAFGFGVAGPVTSLKLGNLALVTLAAVFFAVGQMAFAMFFFLFPTYSFVPRWLRWVALGGAVVVLALLVPLVASRGLPSSSPISGVGVLLFLLGVGTQVYRYRKVSDVVARAQTKWVVYGVATSAGLFVASRGVVFLMPASLRNSQIGTNLVGGGTTDLVLLLIPVCIAMAVLRGRLWDINYVISKTLLYAGLSVCVVAIYVLVVGYLGAALGTRTTLATSLLAAGIVAIVFQRLRVWLQRQISRLIYGLRDEPYAIAAELGRRLEAAAASDSVLAGTVETIGRALKLPYVAIVLREGEPAAEYGQPAAAHGGLNGNGSVPGGGILDLPLTYRSEPVGSLRLAPRRASEQLTPMDLRLLADLSRQIGTVAHAVTLTEDLQRSRERIVAAREEERRRLRRDLHDGLGPTLAGLALKASTISSVVRSDPDAAGRTGDELYSQIRGTIAEVRRLVYQLRPPALDELGLAGALREVAVAQADPSMLEVEITVEEPLPPLPAAVEVAAYRIASEALTNVGRHAQASRCRVSIRCTDVLEIEIADNGRGISPGRPAGVGLVAMRERTAELGGALTIESGSSITGSATTGSATTGSATTGSGTTVLARLPLTSRQEN